MAEEKRKPAIKYIESNPIAHVAGLSLFVAAHIALAVNEKAGTVPAEELYSLISEAQSDKKLVSAVQELEGAVLDDLKKWAKQLHNDTQVILDNYYDHLEKNGTAAKDINLSSLPPEEAKLFLQLDQFDKNLMEKYKAADDACMDGFDFSPLPTFTPSLNK